MKKIIIFSPSDISADFKNQLESKLVAKFGSFPIEYKIDKSLIAGLVIRLGDQEYHYDLRTQLDYILEHVLKT